LKIVYTNLTFSFSVRALLTGLWAHWDSPPIPGSTPFRKIPFEPLPSYKILGSPMPDNSTESSTNSGVVTASTRHAGP